MASSTEKLEKVLGLSDESVEPNPSFEVISAPKRVEGLPAITPETIQQNKVDDYNYARDTMINLLGQGNEALVGLLGLAAEGPAARNYEVIGTLIKTVADVSKDLIELDDKMTPKVEGTTQTAQTINNNQYVMSQAEAIEAAKLLNEE